MPEVLELDGGARLRPAKVAGERAERALAVVPPRGVQPGTLVPADIRTDDRPEQLPEEANRLGVIREGVHPRRHVPIGPVLVVVDNGAARPVHVVDVYLRGENEIRVEAQQ